MEMQVQMPKDFEDQLKRQFVLIADKAITELTSRPQAPEWMDLGTAANYLSVSRGTLTTFIKQGLKVTIVNGTKRIRREDADQFMIAHSI
jgi:hypothetical protein